MWNDPINLMSYVTYVFMNYFKYSREKAEKLMSDVHHEGRAVVSSGTREEMEREQLREAAPATLGGEAGGGEQRGEGGEAQSSRV